MSTLYDQFIIATAFTIGRTHEENMQRTQDLSAFLDGFEDLSYQRCFGQFEGSREACFMVEVGTLSYRAYWKLVTSICNIFNQTCVLHVDSTFRKGINRAWYVYGNGDNYRLGDFIEIDDSDVGDEDFTNINGQYYTCVGGML